MELLPEELGPLLAEELREQLNNLTASVQLLSPVIRECCDRRYDDYLAIMNQSLYRLMRTINNLEFAHLPEGDVVLRREGLDLAGLCRELGSQVEPLARRMDIDFQLEDTVGTLILTGDGSLLRRMVLNLLSNALRAAGEGGRVGLRLTAGRGRATMAVWDNGPGLSAPPEDEGGLIRRPEGLGLGLPVARRIARLHGGTLVLEQREERGLRAVVSLPIQPPEPGELLKTPAMGFDAAGGFSPAMLELSCVLPFGAFLPEDVE